VPDAVFVLALKETKPVVRENTSTKSTHPDVSKATLPLYPSHYRSEVEISGSSEIVVAGSYL
jgi:hypothetical protein